MPVKQKWASKITSTENFQFGTRLGEIVHGSCSFLTGYRILH